MLFDEYYLKIFEDQNRKGRWGKLRAALLCDFKTIPYTENLTKPYFMDKASVIAARMLRLPESGGEILDACAAPGGKSLVIASHLNDTRLISNELSAERRRRLVDVLNAHLPPETRKKVTVSGFDAAALAAGRSERGRFSAVLLDAPCSSERHVLQNQKYLNAWTPARPKFLANRQWALLSSAFLLLTTGGSLVYSTCALDPQENDGVALKLLKKYKTAVALDPPDFAEGEKTKFGRIILPDVCDGMGPIYVARFRVL